jgi:secondary thiamine-phosphate synthase enzyme
VNESHIKEGIISIFSKHSTTAICINEDEIGLKEDFKTFIEKLVPNDKYKHDFIDNNAKSHLKSFLLSSSQTIPVSNGRLELGTWQSVFFVELDGPRTNRTIVITVVGE